MLARKPRRRRGTDRVGRHTHRAGGGANDGVDRIGWRRRARIRGGCDPEVVEGCAGNGCDLLREIGPHRTKSAREGLDLRRGEERSGSFPPLDSALGAADDVAELLLGETEGHATLDDESARGGGHACVS
jgi:hypothetical protein